MNIRACKDANDAAVGFITYADWLILHKKLVALLLSHLLLVCSITCIEDSTSYEGQLKRTQFHLAVVLIYTADLWRGPYLFWRFLHALIDII